MRIRIYGDRAPIVLVILLAILVIYAIMTSNGAHVDTYRVLKIPPFWREDPELWFLQVEATFVVARITVDKTKAHYFVASVGSEVLPHIKDLLSRDPPPENLYTAIKERILSSFAISSEAHLKQLLKGQILGDQRPSYLLTKMRQLSNDQCSDAILRSLFIEQLPESYTPILVTISEPNLQKLVETADKIADSFANTSSSDSLLAAKGREGRNNLSTVASKFADITNRLDKLETSVKKLSRNRGRSRS